MTKLRKPFCWSTDWIHHQYQTVWRSVSGSRENYYQRMLLRTFIVTAKCQNFIQLVGKPLSYLHFLETAVRLSRHWGNWAPLTLSELSPSSSLLRTITYIKVINSKFHIKIPMLYSHSETIFVFSSKSTNQSHNQNV